MRTRLMRISAIVAALVCVAVVPTGAAKSDKSQKSQKIGPPVIIEAIVSGDGTTLFVSGVNFGKQPYFTLDGIPLGASSTQTGPSAIY